MGKTNNTKGEYMYKGVYKDVVGKRFGRLTVLDVEPTKNYHVICACDCGKVKEFWKGDVTSGKTRSCGCVKREYIPISADVTTVQNSFENDKRILDINKLYKKMYHISKSPRKSKKNSSGYVGVFWNKKYRRWIAGIGFRGEHINLGAYKVFEDAIKARKEAEEMLFAPAIMTSKEYKNAIKMC